MGGFYEKDTPALQKAREAAFMAETRDHTAKGGKPMARNLGPETMIHNHGYEGVDLMHSRAGFIPHESAMENAGREEALRIVGAIR